MTKIRSLIFLLLITFSLYGKDYYADCNMYSFSPHNVLNAVKFFKCTMEIIVEKEDLNRDDKFILKPYKSFWSVWAEDMTVINANCDYDNGYKFTRNGQNIDKIRLKVECLIVLNWVMIKENSIYNIYVGNINGRDSVYLHLDIGQFKLIHPINIRVVEDMNLGKTCSGGLLSTQPGGTGTPARLDVSGEKNKEFKVIIPKYIYIYNNKRDYLRVDLYQRREMFESICTYDEERQYRQLYIDGVCKTNRNSNGKYRGKFTVRIEYDT